MIRAPVYSVALGIKVPYVEEVWPVPASLDPLTPGLPKPSPGILLLVSLGYRSEIGEVQESLGHYSPAHQGNPKMLD